MKELETYWNKLNGNYAIEQFESNWTMWTIDDSINWFEYILSSKHDDTDDDSNSDTDSDSDSDSDESNGITSGGNNTNTNDNNDDEKNESNKSQSEAVDYTSVHKNMVSSKFKARKNLPIMSKSFQFKQLGFNNKRYCKLLSKYTKQLMKKYPKPSKKSKAKEGQVEGFVTSTHPH